MPSTQLPMAQFQNPTGSPYGNISTGPGGVALTGVNPQELTSYQLGQLQRSNNPLVQNAAQNAAAFASARGAGLSGSLYADNATRAAFDQMTPIAQADAGQYADVRNRNQSALNDQNITSMNNNTSLGVAGIGASASRYASDNQLKASMAQLNQSKYEFDKQQENRLQNREWQLADQNTAARAAQRSQAFNTMLQTVFSDPSYWRDPQAAIGLMRTYGSNIDGLMADLFPEYFATDQQGNPVNQQNQNPPLSQMNPPTSGRPGMPSQFPVRP